MPIPAGFNPASPLTVYERVQATKEQYNLDFVLLTGIAVAAIVGFGLLYAGYVAGGVVFLGTAAVWTWVQKNKLERSVHPSDLLGFAINESQIKAKPYLVKWLCKSPHLEQMVSSITFNIPHMFSSRSSSEHFVGFQILCRTPEFRALMKKSIFSLYKVTFVRSAVRALMNVHIEGGAFNLPKDIQERQVAIFKELINAGLLNELKKIKPEDLLEPEEAENMQSDLIQGEREKRQTLFADILREAQKPAV